MKLIKLSGNSGDFENIFNEDIKLEPYSKIGLLSASILLKGIDVNETNNEFTIQTKKKNPVFDVILSPGTYTKQSFVQELQKSELLVFSNC